MEIYRNPLNSIWKSCENPMDILWYSYGNPMESYGNPAEIV